MSKNSKLNRLRKILKSLKKVVIAYSGGVDSSFLLKAAIDSVGRDNVLAVTARSETYPDREYKEAKALARYLKANHMVITTEELSLKGFKSNPVERCYYCKKELFSKLKKIKEKYKFCVVADGTNYDDRKDIRFGTEAARELGVKSPLSEAGVTKNDIRRFSRKLKLPTYNKPSFACLASRIPTSSKITKKRLSRIDRAECFLRELGFRQVRVRDYGALARIEVEKKAIAKLLRLDLKMITARFKKFGYRYVTLDLEGYRTGSMHLSEKPL